DDDGRDPRDGVRARGGHQDAVHGWGSDRRGGRPQGGLLEPAFGPAQAVLLEDPLRMRRFASAALLLCLVACSAPDTSVTPSSLPVLTQPDNPNQPYGIVAIEYHFHDAHPSVPLEPTRTVIWTNEGTLKHNVTIPQINFSKDFTPGQTIKIKDLGRKLGGAGTYQFFC